MSQMGIFEEAAIPRAMHVMNSVNYLTGVECKPVEIFFR